MKGIIYKATNKINGKCYIGQTTRNIDIRTKEHIYESLIRRHRSIIHDAIRKYGSDNFEWEVLCECDTRKELNEMEFHYIKQYDTYKNGYNSTYGGEGISGFKVSDRTKEKLSRSAKKAWDDKNSKYHTKEYKENLSKRMKGRIFTEEHKRKMRENHNGGVKHHTEETKRMISEGQIGEKNQFWGRHHTEETKEIIRQKVSGSNHVNSKKYIITDPNGNEFIIDGIRSFCKKIGLYHSGFIACAKGKQKTTKGYKCRYV